MNDTNIGKLSKKSNRKSKKVTDLKTKNLMKMQWKHKMYTNLIKSMRFLAATVLFIYFLELPSFL